MVALDDELPFAAEIERIRAAAVQRTLRLRRVRKYCLLGGLAVGILAWHGVPPPDRDGIHFGFTLALAAATFAGGGLLGRLLLPKAAAQCPQCGWDWDAESEHDPQRWLAWHRCPHCGLQLTHLPPL
ncbi:MAG TPA: hypothetical protein PKM73_01000 [Verrucomicrobiota bacterium]|nr:hypothetical protein [Verrucomicrobiota bacterium]HNU52825.1 hypothetical protein [Verrucomicrobiota bacterium]